jgi:hypothetical protein
MAWFNRLKTWNWLLIAAAFTQNTNNNHLAHEEKVARAAEPKLPSDKFTVTLGILLEYLETADENNLPTLWHNWANCKKTPRIQCTSRPVTSLFVKPRCVLSQYTCCLPTPGTRPTKFYICWGDLGWHRNRTTTFHSSRQFSWTPPSKGAN